MMCGVDEAGRGPVMGPLVVAGVASNDDAHLKALGVKDSKRLTAARREKLSEEIRSTCKYEFQIVPAADIDLLRQNMTLNVLEANLFATIIGRLDVTVAYADAADSNEARFGEIISKELGGKVKIIAEHKADDNYPIVSAASIIAKVERDHAVAKIRKELGKEFGSGYPSDTRTIRFLEEWVKEHNDLPPYTRRSWKTASRILNNSKVRKISDY